MGVWSGGEEDLMEEASVYEEQGCAQEVDLVSPILTGVHLYPSGIPLKFCDERGGRFKMGD